MRMMQLRIGRVTVIAGIALYIMILYVTYINLISPAYSYYQLINLHPPLWIILLSSFMAVLPSFWSDYRVDRPSQVIYWILYLFAYIPVVIIPDFIREDPLDSFWLFKLSVFISLGTLCVFGKIPLIPIKNSRLSTSVVNISLFLYMFILYGVIIQTFGFHVNPVSFKDVYGVREVFRSEASRLSGYAITWLSKIMDMFLIAIGMLKGQLLLILIGIFGQAYVYSITGHKSVVLSVCLLFMVLFCLRNKGQTFGIRFTWCMSLFVGIALLMDYSNNTITFTEIFTRRMLLLPGALSSLFFDFFSTNPKTYLGHSIFHFFVEYPYNANPSSIIGFVYFGSEKMSANANMWADGYSAFGYAGVIVFSLLLAVILWIYDSIAQNRNFMVSVALMVMPAWSLVDSSFIIALITNGIFIAIALNYVYRSDLWKGKVNVKSENTSNAI